MTLFNARLSIVLMVAFVCVSADGCFRAPQYMKSRPRSSFNLHHPRLLLSHPHRRRELIHALKTCVRKSLAALLKPPVVEA
jgi:hypothetical protein